MLALPAQRLILDLQLLRFAVQFFRLSVKRGLQLLALRDLLIQTRTQILDDLLHLL
jgi:hypothetical protein